MVVNDLDLFVFCKVGGKLIIWYGFVDEVILFNGIIVYMEEVLNLDFEFDEYIWFFEVFGVGYCYGGVGVVLDDVF